MIYYIVNIIDNKIVHVQLSEGNWKVSNSLLIMVIISVL